MKRWNSVDAAEEAARVTSEGVAFVVVAGPAVAGAVGGLVGDVEEDLLGGPGVPGHAAGEAEAPEDVLGGVPAALRTQAAHEGFELAEVAREGERLEVPAPAGGGGGGRAGGGCPQGERPVAEGVPVAHEAHAQAHVLAIRLPLNGRLSVCKTSSKHDW